jgi:hypothetical protein
MPPVPYIGRISILLVWEMPFRIPMDDLGVFFDYKFGEAPSSERAKSLERIENNFVSLLGV